MEKTTEAPSGGWHRAFAWTTAAITVALLVGALTIHVDSGGPWPGDTSDFTLLPPLLSVLVGAVIIHRQGNHLVGWAFCVSGLSWSVYILSMSYVQTLSEPGQLPFEGFVLWSSTWTSLLGFALAPGLMLFVFPTGRLPNPGWRRTFAIVTAAIAVAIVGTSLAPGAMEDIPDRNNPIGVGGPLGEIALVLRELVWPLILVSIAFGVRSLRVRARSASSQEQQQIKWIAFGGSVAMVSVVTWGVLEMSGHGVPSFFSGLFPSFIPIAVGIAILRYRLYDIDVLINRTLVYVSLSAVLAAFYLGTVFLLQELLSPITPESDLAIAASTLAVAGLFGPLRTRIQAFIDRRFYRSKYDAEETLANFSAQVRNQVDIEALSQEVVDVVSSTVQPAHASLWLRDREGSPT